MLLYINGHSQQIAKEFTGQKGKKQRLSAALLLLSVINTMGIQKSFLRHVVFALLAASIIAKVDCLPKAKVDEPREQEMETIRANILSRLGLTEPLDSGEPLTEDEEAVVAAFKDYQTAEKVKTDMTTTKYTLVGQLRKQGTVIPYCYQYGVAFIPGDMASIFAGM